MLRLHYPILIRDDVGEHRLRVDYMGTACELPQHVHLLMVRTGLLLFGGLPLRHADRKCLRLYALCLLLLLVLRDAHGRGRIRVYDLLVHHWLV